MQTEQAYVHFRAQHDNLKAELEAGNLNPSTYRTSKKRLRDRAAKEGLTVEQIDEIFPAGKSGPKWSAAPKPKAAPSTPAEELPVSAVVVDMEVQQRVEHRDPALVVDYAELIRKSDSWPFPPLVVFRDGDGIHHLADGFHRIAAAVDNKIESVPCIVSAGDKRAALLHACGANADHGKRRTNADKAKAVRTLLADEEWSGRSDNWIAGACKVSPHTVAAVRLAVESEARRDADTLQTQSESVSPTPDDERTTRPAGNESTMKTQSGPSHPGNRPKPRKTKDGRTMDTSNIGKKPKPKPAPAPVDAMQLALLVGTDLKRLRDVDDKLLDQDAFRLCQYLRDSLIRYLPRLAEKDRAAMVEKICAGGGDE